MKCPFNIKAANGNNSKLFKDMVEATSNPIEAVDMYYSTFTKPFKDIYGDWQKGEVKDKLDENGEPLWSSFSEEKFIYDKEFAEIELEGKADVYKKLASFQPTLQTAIEEKINDLESRNNPNLADTIKKLKGLKETVDGSMLVDSVPAFLLSAKNHIAHLKNLAINEVDKTNPDFGKLAGYYKASQSYDVINEIEKEIMEVPEIRQIIGDKFDTSAVVAGEAYIQKLYLSQAKKFIAKELTKRNPQWTTKHITDMLDSSPRDVKFVEQMFETMADSRDQVLAAIANVVGDQENAIRRSTIEFTKELQDATEALEKKHGGAKAEQMFKDLIYQKDNGELHILNLGAENTNGKDAAQDAMYQKVQAVKSNKELFDFFTFFYGNYAKLQKMLPPGQRMGTRLPQITKASWERTEGKNPMEVATLFADDVKKKFAASNLDMDKGQLVDSTGKPVRRVPTFYTQKYDSVDYNDFYQTKYDELIAGGMETEAAVMESSKYAEVEATKKSAEFVTRDLAYSLAGFQAMAVNYSYKNEIITLLDASVDVIGSDSRTYNRVNSKGNTLYDSKGKPRTIGGAESNAIKMLTQFIDSKVYGMTSKDLGTIDVIGLGAVDVDKLLRQINNSTSLIQLSGNIFSALPNLGNGEYNNFMEAFGGEYYDIGNYKKVSAVYRKNLAGVLGDIGQRTPKNLVNLLDEHYNMMQDYNSKGDVMVSEGSTAKRMMKTNLLFFMNNAGEHFMQTRTAMAVMDATKAYDKSGAEIGSLLDQHSAKDGEMIIAEGTYVKNIAGELVKYDTEEQNRIGRKMNAVTRKLYGNYSPLTANAMKQDARLALFTKFRDWAAEGIWRRFGGKQPYLNLEQEVEGFYRTGGRVGLQMIKDLKQLKFDMMKENWANLTPHEKANIRRVVAESAAITLLFASSAMLGWAGKNVEDEFDGDNFSDRLALGSFRMLTYQTNRLYSELFAYINPVEALRIARSPVAATSIAENTTKLISQILVDPTEQYETGWRKGEYKVFVRGEKLVPLYKHLKVLNPDGIEDKGVFYEL